MSTNKNDGQDDDDVKFIHDIIDDLAKEGFVVTGCVSCKDKYPQNRPARCRFCGQTRFPKDQMNN